VPAPRGEQLRPSDAIGGQRRRSLRSLRRPLTTTGVVMALTDAAFSSDADRPVSPRGLKQEPLPLTRSRSRPGSRDSRGSGESCKLLGSGASVRAGSARAGGERELSGAEAAMKQTQASDWFKQASSINASQGQTLEEKMQAFRVRRTERATSKENASSECSKETPRGYKQGTPRSPCGQDAGSGSSSTTAGTRRGPSASSGSADAGALKSAEGEPSRKPNLLEKFGYGVRPKSKQEPKPEAVDMSAYTKKKTVMVEVKAGENDLLERLRRKGSRSNTVP